MIRATATTLLVAGLGGLGCGSDPISKPDDPPSDPTGRSPAEVAEAIGRGDGSPGSVRLEVVFEPVSVSRAGGPALMMPTALDWNPVASDELWITLVEDSVEAPCTPSDSAGCTALEGRMGVVHGASSAAPESEVVSDGTGWHFLRRPMGIAFAPPGRRQFLCTCGEARTANYTDEEVPYNGPVLWDANRSIFGATPSPGMNGTHVDMLHATPYCMGVASEQANVFWVFNGDAGSFDRYDFNLPHDPGGEDHSDGEIWRYGEGELARVPGVPSGMAYDERRRQLFVADSGNGRLVALDTASGFEDGDITAYETMPTHVRMSGAVIRDVMTGLEVPSGLTLHEGVLFVVEHGASRIVALEPSGNVLRELDTGLPANSMGGVSLGPDNKAYITDIVTGSVYRIEAL
jgi:sugar lactone lactonase YvrE